ncbi:PREDICTED: uncharacterized protein LOC109193407 [Ipomoea nil]|uniref:uncharacterized protein LOC109193407 n=1 Tax=Ipomoea nil TaxID=35883 RepID=UPI000900BC2F|nr:PREDICTED: uncharacterized protein LOC109193407 [Ipomoea nil]
MGLMDQQTGTWDPDILTDIFIPEDVERIKKIPVSPRYDDLWYWYGDPNGEYSVKNGYRKLVGNYSQPLGTFDKWKRVDIDPTCAMCGASHEDIVHSLITCGYTTNIWIQSHLPIPNSVTNVFSDWINDLMNVLGDNEIIYAVAILYYTWCARNGAVWDACLPRPQKVIAMASSAVHSWKIVHPTHTHPRVNAAVMEQVEAPTIRQQNAVGLTAEPAETVLPLSSSIMQPHGQQQQPNVPYGTPLMCYFDAAYDPRTSKAAAGAIILDAQGGYIAAMTTPMSDCFTPLMAEALACKEVLSWLRNRGIDSIQLFTDCLVLQQYLSSTTRSPRSYLGYAIDSCRTSILVFENCLIRYVPRLDNYLAHTLASITSTQTTIMYADSSPPAAISAYFE